MREVGEAGGGRAPTFPLDLRGVLGHPSCRDITSRRSNASPLLQPAAVTPPSSAGSPPSEPENDKYAKRPVSRLAKRLDIFPKTERDYTVRTERGGAAHRDRVRDNGDGDARGVDDVRRAFDRDRLEHIVVDTRNDTSSEHKAITGWICSRNAPSGGGAQATSSLWTFKGRQEKGEPTFSTREL